MYRRKAGDAAPTSGGSGGSSPKQPARVASSRRGGDRDGSQKLSAPVILTIVVCVLFGCVILLSILSPSSVHDAETKIMEAEQMVENEILHQFGGGIHEKVIPPVPHQEQRRSMDATEAMLAQDSSWVDGEKKLKKKLKILAERQAQGKDLGVPVLTRWLGDDIPAWAGEGVDKEEWKKKVDAKYAEMREQENEWRAKVAHFMDK